MFWEKGSTLNLRQMMVAENRKTEINPANRRWQVVASSSGVVAQSFQWRSDLQPLAVLEGIRMAIGALSGISSRAQGRTAPGNVGRWLVPFRR
jgi:hypothetical protein